MTPTSHYTFQSLTVLNVAKDVARGSDPQALDTLCQYGPPQPPHPQLGIGPDATSERKKPNLLAELSACTTSNFLWLPDLGSNQGPTD